MNIFALSDNPYLAAIWQHDKHVVKMTLETAQLLSTAIRMDADDNHGLMACCPERKTLYGVTHQHHPCTRWIMESPANMAWLIKHGYALADEYTERFGKRHASKRIIELAADTLIRSGNDYKHAVVTPFAQAMPARYKETDDAVLAYRRYYLAEKCRVDTKWTRRSQLPDWLLDKALDFRAGAKVRGIKHG